MPLPQAFISRLASGDSGRATVRKTTPGWRSLPYSHRMVVVGPLRRGRTLTAQ